MVNELISSEARVIMEPALLAALIAILSNGCIRALNINGKIAVITFRTYFTEKFDVNQNKL